MNLLANLGGIENLSWEIIIPNEAGDWINQRDPVFAKFIPLANGGKKAHAIFDTRSLGISTNRDSWAYNDSREVLQANMKRMIATYNEESERFANTTNGGGDIVEWDPKRIKWSSKLIQDARQGKKHSFSADAIRQSMYRPFNKRWLYFSHNFNDRPGQQSQLFPSEQHPNMVICATGRGANKPFSCLISNTTPALSLMDGGAQSFPLYWYEKVGADAHRQADMTGVQPEADAHGYVRHDAVSDWALEQFRSHYQDASIVKQDIFHYVYGVLHSPEYRRRFAADLKKMLPRIPFAANFAAFRIAGERLARLHLEYESAAPYPLEEVADLLPGADAYRVQKMRFGRQEKEKDRSVIHYNDHITLRGIPEAAYEYVVNGKSAIEWVMDRYQVRVDTGTRNNPGSHIRNDPNEWSRDPRYVIDLLKRVVTVSLETAAIVDALPPLEEKA